MAGRPATSVLVQTRCSALAIASRRYAVKRRRGDSEWSDADAGEDLLPLGLVQPAPDAVGLTDPDRVVEALLLHRTLAADRLGPRLAFVLLVFPLERRRWEEHRRL